MLVTAKLQVVRSGNDKCESEGEMEIDTVKKGEI